MAWFPFISDEDIHRIVQEVLVVAERAQNAAERSIHRTGVDPFSALFDAYSQQIDFETWYHQEKVRKAQKTLQNRIGTFHEDIISCMSGWEKHSGVFDLISTEQRIIAEVKNKYNTTKGNHKRDIYDDLVPQITVYYPNYTAYYVEIIPRPHSRYNEEFTPPDNRSKTNRPANPQIRRIDGYSFYALITGQPDALYQLYEAIPLVISSIQETAETDFQPFRSLFEQTYGAKE